MTFYTSLGDHGLMWLLISGLLLISKKTRRAGLTALLAVVFGAFATNVVIKNLVMRPRPFIFDPSLTPLVTTNDMNSFPSGHTTAAFAAATGWFLGMPRAWRWRGAVFLTAVLMGASRMYVGMHYPTDVLAGMVIGVAAGLLAGRVYEKGRGKWYETHGGENP